MQKKLIAAAIAAVASTGAFAQVTVYGIVDVFGAMGTSTQGTNVANTTKADKKFAGVNAGGLSGSRLGFKAEEDLGGGMAAVADILLGSLTLDSATNSIGNTRQSYLGLKTTSGTIVAGRLQTSGFDYMGGDNLGASAFDPLANFCANYKATATGNTCDVGGGSAINAGSRVENAVGYMNTFGPVSVKLARSQASETPGTSVVTGGGTVRMAVTNVGVTFNQGPVKADLVYIDQADVTTSGGIKDLALAGYYNLGVAKLGLNYVQTTFNTTPTTVKMTAMQLGASIPVGKGVINGAYATAKTDVNGDKKASGFGIDYEHALGKRTTAYVGYYTGTSGNNVGVKGVAGGSVNAAGTPTADAKVSTFGVGGRLTF